jgi:hypothetical protein
MKRPAQRTFETTRSLHASVTRGARAAKVAVALGGVLAGGCSLLVDTSGLSGSAADASSDGGLRSSSSDATAGADGPSGPSDSGLLEDGALNDGATADDAASGPCTPSGTIESVTKLPTVVVDDARTGTIAWINPMNALATDGTFARSTTMVGNVNTHWLLARGYGVALPPRAMVHGFVVEVRRQASFTDEIGDFGVAMVLAGTPGSTKSTPGAWPTNPVTVSYGSPSDLWGATWSADQVNAADFGVAFAARGLPADAERASVDSIQVTVHFERCTQ